MEKQLDKLFTWAFVLGKKLKEKDSKYGEILIFDLRSEETPGRFFNKLALRIADFNKRLGIEVTLSPDIIHQKLKGDNFYYVKAAILSGLINSIYSNKKENE
ncbi:MAG: hypothetical protein QXY70_01825 [Nanopusillaceae archaeon]